MKLKPNKMQQTLGFRVREPVDWEKVKGLLDQLYAASGRLGALFPGRKFTLDGHLVAVLEKSSPPTCSTWTSHGRPVKGTTHSRPIGGRWRSSSRSRKVTLWLFATNPNTSLSCNAPRPARCLPRVSGPRPLRLLRLPMLRAQRPGRRRLYLHHLEYLRPNSLDRLDWRVGPGRDYLPGERHSPSRTSGNTCSRLPD